MQPGSPNGSISAVPLRPLQAAGLALACAGCDRVPGCMEVLYSCLPSQSSLAQRCQAIDDIQRAGLKGVPAGCQPAAHAATNATDTAGRSQCIVGTNAHRHGVVAVEVGLPGDRRGSGQERVEALESDSVPQRSTGHSLHQDTAPGCVTGTDEHRPELRPARP
jgi:hypothetical protein